MMLINLSQPEYSISLPTGWLAEWVGGWGRVGVTLGLLILTLMALRMVGWVMKKEMSAGMW